MYKTIVVIAFAILLSTPFNTKSKEQGSEGAPSILNTDEFKGLPNEIVIAAMLDAKDGLKPEQIEMLNRLKKLYERADKSNPIKTKAIRRVVEVDLPDNLITGTKEAFGRINYQPGMDSFISFIDKHGTPWPIQMISIGNSSFTAHKAKEEKEASADQTGEAKNKSAPTKSELFDEAFFASMRRITATEDNKTSNLSVKLEGLPNVLTFEIKASEYKFNDDKNIQATVDTDTVFLINEVGPITKLMNTPRKNTANQTPVRTTAGLQSNNSAQSEELISTLLTGSKPRGAYFIPNNSRKVKSWVYNGKLLIVRRGNRIPITNIETWQESYKASISTTAYITDISEKIVFGYAQDQRTIQLDKSSLNRYLKTANQGVASE